MSSVNASAAIRLAHFSDIHVTVRPLGWTLADLLSKKLTGWMNIKFLGRGYRFRDADVVLAALAEDLRRRRPDHVVFSGDATTLGFESELAHATKLLGVGDESAPPGIAVPGNHDYYTRAAAASGLFERYFAPWQRGQRIDNSVYPFAQRVGPVWLVGVNTSAANPWTWDASGRIDAPQLDRLRRLLAFLAPGPRVLVTHYPVCVVSGKPERRTHGLRNATELVAVAAEGGVCLWLHGHRHGPYHVYLPAVAPFPIVCSGSATQHGHWSYVEYEIAEELCRVSRRVFSAATREFIDGEKFDLVLSCAKGSSDCP